jgi:thiamine-phosphate pyrophosphorylase
LHVFIWHQLNWSQSEMQRWVGCAQAPAIFGMCMCRFAASVGDSVAVTKAAASTIFVMDLIGMERPPSFSAPENVPYTGDSHKQRLSGRMAPCDRERLYVTLPDPPLLLVTGRRQARRPLADIVAAALAAGCRWVSLREKDLPDDDQILLARTLLPQVRACGARLMLHGEASLAKHAGAVGVHLPAGSDVVAARALLGPGKLIGLSIHTITEAAAIDPTLADYALAGPAFETASKPGYGPEIGRKGLAEMAHAARVPLLAIGGINTVRVAEVMAAGCAGVAVMGGVMRAADPGQEVRALVATLNGYPRAR